MASTDKLIIFDTTLRDGEQVKIQYGFEWYLC
jgi:isopropylmalate/homocitrate/citramalate synthase